MFEYTKDVPVQQVLANRGAEMAAVTVSEQFATSFTVQEQAAECGDGSTPNVQPQVMVVDVPVQVLVVDVPMQVLVVDAPVQVRRLSMSGHGRRR
jgi:hypothetical protein